MSQVVFHGLFYWTIFKPILICKIFFFRNKFPPEPVSVQDTVQDCLFAYTEIASRDRLSGMERSDAFLGGLLKYTQGTY